MWCSCRPPVAAWCDAEAVPEVAGEVALVSEAANRSGERVEIDGLAEGVAQTPDSDGHHRVAGGPPPTTGRWHQIVEQGAQPALELQPRGAALAGAVQDQEPLVQLGTVDDWVIDRCAQQLRAVVEC
jgi:hypothetical protein